MVRNLLSHVGKRSGLTANYRSPNIPMSHRAHLDPPGKPGAPGQLPDHREKLRQAVLARRPWLHSTGPRNEAGKQRSAQNGRATQKAERSVRQLRAELAPVTALAKQMAVTRDEVGRLLLQHAKVPGNSS